MNIKIIYETQTGTTNYVAEVLQRVLSQKGHQVQLHSVKYHGPQPNLDGVELVIFGGPTYDDGLLEKTLRSFIKEYQPDLSSFKVAVFGLGNRTYPQFCKSADILAEWVQQRGGHLLIDLLKVDAFPDNLQPVYAWADQLQQSL